MRTAGPILSDTPNTDLQLFVPATQGVSLNAGTGVSTPPASYVGVIAAGSSNAAVVDTIAIAASSTVNLKFNLTELLIRTGILQSNNYATNTSQEAFGTANGPGPNATAGTSDPSGMGYGSLSVIDENAATEVLTDGSNTKAPVQTALLPTLTGPWTNNSGTVNSILRRTKANTKGIRIKWIDLVYRVNGVALTLASVGLWQYTFALGHNSAVTLGPTNFTSNPTVLPSAALAINSTVNKVHRERTLIQDFFGNPASFIVDDGTLLYALAEFETPSGSTANLLGLIFGCDFNLN